MIKAPFEFIRKVDDKVLGVINDAYLWVLDWTGIYVGTIVFISCAPSFVHLWNGGGSRWITVIWLTMLLFFTGQLYWNQSLGNKIAFNLAADFNKAMYPRPFFYWVKYNEYIYRSCNQNRRHYLPQ